jgi:predicted tellurium resistance membrane protein TerC
VRRFPWLTELAMLVGAFVGATLLAEAFGADNLGTALTFGQIAFAATLVWIVLRRK